MVLVGAANDRPLKRMFRFSRIIPGDMYRLLAVLSFICIFTVGVICAMACPEEPIVLDQPGPGHECTECISTHFLAGDRTLSVQISTFYACLDSAQPEFDPALLIESFTFVSPPGNALSFCPTSKSVFRI